MGEAHSIYWTPALFEDFKKAYNKANAANENKNAVFTFDSQQFVISYAKYLIEYLESGIGK